MHPGVSCPRCLKDDKCWWGSTTNEWEYVCDRCNLRFNEEGRIRPMDKATEQKIEEKNAQIDHRFLIRADFSSMHPPLNDEDPIWIKAPDGEVDSMTYAEFRSHSRVLLASRPLPDGKVSMAREAGNGFS